MSASVSDIVDGGGEFNPVANIRIGVDDLFPPGIGEQVIPFAQARIAWHGHFNYGDVLHRIRRRQHIYAPGHPSPIGFDSIEAHVQDRTPTLRRIHEIIMKNVPSC